MTLSLLGAGGGIEGRGEQFGGSRSRRKWLVKIFGRYSAAVF